MRGGQLRNYSPTRPINDLWMTIGQALMQTSDPMAALADESFVKTGVSPIEGLWQPPP
jgi:hypothetical protein